MKKLYLILLCLPSVLMAQVTLRITSIPGNTPNAATIYLAGTVNNWNATDSDYIMQPDGLGAYQIVIPEGTGSVQYKFTRGGWPTVEGNASGGYLPDRTFTFTGNPQVLNLTIQSWEDIAGSGSNSTAASNVQVLNPTFFIPQLNVTRKVWVYLPPDYYTTTKTYPVLYMQDGQNLFDNATAPYGEWQIDETLNQLHSQGNYGAIVVGIDNDGGSRLDEYSPWINSEYGGGEGDLYMQFIGETLKPYIDSNFRSKPQSQFNALIGSSMGALISTYGAVKYPNLFSKIGSFSPAYWFALSDMNNYVTASSNDVSNLRFYFVAGQNEMAEMVPDMNVVRNNLVSKGVQSSNTFTKVDSYGTHSETYWRGEFSAAYLWLFANETLNISQNNVNVKIVQVQNKLFVEGLENNQKVILYSILGQNKGEISLTNGYNELPSSLSKGIYLIKLGAKTIKIAI